MLQFVSRSALAVPATFYIFYLLLLLLLYTCYCYCIRVYCFHFLIVTRLSDTDCPQEMNIGWELESERETDRPILVYMSAEQ